MAKAPKKSSGSSPKAREVKPKARTAKPKAKASRAKAGKEIAAAPMDAVFMNLTNATTAFAGPPWACPDDGTQDLENRVLVFLQTQARWCRLDEVCNGVDPRISEARYIRILKLTLPGRGCSTFAENPGGDLFRALFSGETHLGVSLGRS